MAGKVTNENNRTSIEEFTRDTRDGDQNLQEQLSPSEQAVVDGLRLSPSEPPGQSLESPAGEDGDDNVGGESSDGLAVKIEEFKFLSCDPIGQAPEGDPCPLCVPNEYAYVPDFRLMGGGEVFFNGKNCTQNVVLAIPSPANGGPTVEQLKEDIRTQSIRGLELLLDYFNKSDQMTAWYYVPNPPKVDPFNLFGGVLVGGLVGSILGPGGAILGALVGAASSSPADNAGKPLDQPGYTLKAETINTVNELLPYTTYQIHVPIQKKARTRILISVPVEQFNRVPEPLVSEPDSIFETRLEVTYDGRNFLPLLRRVARSFKVYNGQLRRWRTVDGGSLVKATNRGKPDPLDLEEEAENIKLFYKEIQSFIEEAGFSFSPLRPERNVEKITFKFEELGPNTIGLRQIIFNKPGCEDIRVTKNGRYKGMFKELTKKRPFSRTRTLYYIGAAPEIDIDLQAREPTPWLQVVTKYTYPALEVRYGANSNSVYSDPSLIACLGKGPVNEFVDDFANEFEDLLLSAPDLFLELFADSTCLTRDEYREELRELQNEQGGFDDKLKAELKRVLTEAKKGLAFDNPYLNIVFEELFPGEASYSAAVARGQSTPNDPSDNPPEFDTKTKEGKKAYREYLKDNEYKFWSRLFDRLGYCGFIALTAQAIDCVAKGITGETANQLLAQAAFSSMDNNHLGRVFLGLSPEQQESIVGAVEREFGQIPAPWDPEYRSGDVSSYEFSRQDIKSTKTQAELGEEQLYIDRYGEDWRQNTRLDQEDVERAEANIKAAGQAARQETIENYLAEREGAGGSQLGTAAGEVALAVANAYKNAMLELVGADELLEQLNKLPGAPIIARVFKHIPCKLKPPIYLNPKIEDFVKDLELDLCEWNTELTVPFLVNTLGKIPDIFKKILELARAAIEAVLVAILVSLLKLILTKIFSLACDLIATAGTSLLDLFSDNNHFGNLLKENMCPDATNDDLYDSLKDLFSTVGGPEASCLESLSNNELAEFIDDLSLMLTQEQIIELINGNVRPETMQLALEVAATSNSDCISEIFSNPDAFLTFFPALRPFIPNLAQLNSLLATQDLNAPVYPCPPEVLRNIDDLRCQLLAEKGLTPEECREQLDDLKDQAVQDLSDLLDAIQNGPYADGVPPIFGDPCENPIMNSTDPFVADMESSITSYILEDLERNFVNDMWGPINRVNGRCGTLNALLSDTKGRLFKRHNTTVRLFGSPLARDLGFFEFASDNAIEINPQSVSDDDPYEKSGIVDNEGRPLSGTDAKGNSFFGKSEGGFPPTIGFNMYTQLANAARSVEVTTLVSPEGKFDAYRRVFDENNERLRARKKYADAWIRQFEFEEKLDPDKEVKWQAGKKARAAADIRLGVLLQGPSGEDPLFIEGEPNNEPSGIKDYSPEQRARNVLLGKDISVGGQLYGNKKVKNWDDKAKRLLPKGMNPDEADNFVDSYTYPDGTEWFRLRELPDTSSADIILKYRGYIDDPSGKAVNPGFECSVEYDYNLIDLETSQLLDDFSYNIRVVETHRSPVGGGLTKKEIKKLGGDVPPVSILKEKDYTYTKYDITLAATPDEDVNNLIESLVPINTRKTREGGLNFGTDVPDSLSIEILYRYFRDIIESKTSNLSSTLAALDEPRFRNYFAPTGYNKFDLISQGFLSRISMLIATGKDSLSEDSIAAQAFQTHKISPGFLFGYDPEKEPKIEELDPALYGGPLGRAFPELVPPPFYVQERKHKGWMSISNALVPELDGCEPKRQMVYSLGDLDQVVGELKNGLTPDRRLEFDPTCIKEAPFDRVMDGYKAANIDAVLRATIRAYVLDAFVRGIPVFTTFAPTDMNFGEALEAFIAEQIKFGLYEDGRPGTGATDDEYYYRVIEQAANLTIRKLESGLLSETELLESERDALGIILAARKDFYIEYSNDEAVLSDIAIRSQSVLNRVFTTPPDSPFAGLGAGSNNFSKVVAKNKKKAAFLTTVAANEEAARIFLRRYIREELEVIKNSMNLTLSPKVENIHHLFLINQDWIAGAVYGKKAVYTGPYDVAGDVRDSSTYNIPSGATIRETAYTSEEQWPFVLEKYILIDEKEYGKKYSSVTNRGQNLFNVVNMNQWYDYVQELDSEIARETGSLSKNTVRDMLISDLWGTPALKGETSKIEDHSHTYEIDASGNGFTSVHVDSQGNEHRHEINKYKVQTGFLDGADNGHRHDLPSEGWKFGLRISYLPENDKQGLFRDMVNEITEEQCNFDKAFKLSTKGGQRVLIPVASAEIPIADQKFSLFDPATYDVYCLIEELIKTPEYRLLFDTLFPLRRFTTLWAIYCINNFFDSIGNSGTLSGDVWEVAGGRRGKGFRKWARDNANTMYSTRKTARKMFTSLYESSQAIDFDYDDESDRQNSVDSIREFLRPKVNFEDGLRWWQRGRRIHRKPTNGNNENC